jgi:hypothetical protein
MKLNHYADTDSLCIDLSGRVSVETREISLPATVETIAS